MNLDFYITAATAIPSSGIAPNPSAAGTKVASIRIAAGQSVQFTGPGAYYKDGLYVVASGSGTLLGQLFIA